jgi:hypothetical protein
MHRGWMDSPDFTPEPFTEPQAFCWSIEQAAFEPHLQWFNGHQIAVGRGEFATSSRKLATVFRWGDKRTRLFLARMERRGKWAQRPAQEGAHLATILTVCNYERFQAPARREGAAEGAAKGEPGAQRGRSEGAQQKELLINSNEGEGIREEASPSRSLAPALPYAAAVEAWSQAAALKRWSPVKPTLPLSDKRRKGLGKILSAHGLDGWVRALQRAMESSLLGGPDPPGWFNFSFLCNPENFTKLDEGNYDRPFTSNRPAQRQSGWLEANAALSRPL